MASCSSTGKTILCATENKNKSEHLRSVVFVQKMQSTCRSHTLYFTWIYRDKTEELKQLTPTERQELKNQDARNGYGASSSYDRSRRRERALKIYVDSSPKKRDE